MTSAQSPKFVIMQDDTCGGAWRVVSARRCVRSLPNRPPDRQKLLPPLLAHGVAIEPLELLDRVCDRLAGRCNGGGRIAVGAADRLGDDLVDDTEAGEVLRGDLHAGRGFLRLGGVAPQDRGGAFR